MKKIDAPVQQHLKPKKQRILHPVKRKLRRYPYIKQIAEKYPRLFFFFIKRFSTKDFFGLPFTILLACFFANLSLLNEIAESFENSPPVIFIDDTIAQNLFEVRNAFIAKGFYYFTQLGSIPVVAIISAGTFFFFAWQRKFIYVISLATTLAGTGITVFLGKKYFHRVRPIDFSYYSEITYSFPSGHATLAVSFYGLLFYVLMSSAQKRSTKSLCIAVALATIAFIGFSRMYLGVHYFSDVIAGYSLGLLWLMLAISIVKWGTRNHEKILQK